MNHCVIIAATVASHLRAFHLPWARHLRSQGYTVIGAARDVSSCTECKSAFSYVMDVPFSRNPLSSAQILTSGRRIERLCEETNADLIHFHTPNAAFWGRLGIRKLVGNQRIKVVYTAHGFHFLAGGKKIQNRIYYTAEAFAARYTHALVTINEEDFLAARAFTLADGGRIDLIPGVGVDLARFDPARFDIPKVRISLRESLGLSKTIPLLLMIAEFSPGKRHRDLVTAVRQCADQDFCVLLAGVGKQKTSIERLIHDHHLDHRFRFLGFRSDVPELIAGCDLVALPSEREGLPASIMEAMAMAKPVIGATARGTRDLLQGNCGWLHEIGDARGLSDLISTILANSDEAKKRGDNARKRILENFGWETVRTKLMSIYMRLGVGGCLDRNRCDKGAPAPSKQA